MGAKLHPKHHISRDVYDLACDRVSRAFKRVDTMVVWFSGGKDSTAVLNLAIEVGRALNRQRSIRIGFYDEEVIPPDTVDYCERVRSLYPDSFDWLCLPVKHRNACSSRFPWWYPYQPEIKHLWARPLPEFGKTEKDYPQFKRVPMPITTGWIYPPHTFGNVCSLMGVRTQESLNRFQAIAYCKTGHDAFMSADQWKHVVRAYPIYDWNSDDVWYAPEKFGWDYNTAYDVMAKAGIPVHHQRCAPPYGEQPLERLWTYHICWPSLWDKMVYRVPGAATAGRYARTALYGYGSADDAMKPKEMSWRDFVMLKVREFPAEDQPTVSAGLTRLLDDHAMRTKDPMPDGDPHPESGLCWQKIAKIVIRGDIKGRKVIAMRATTRKWVEDNRKKQNAKRSE